MKGCATHLAADGATSMSRLVSASSVSKVVVHFFLLGVDDDVTLGVWSSVVMLHVPVAARAVSASARQRKCERWRRTGTRVGP
jgi:hypothetical protein